MFHPVGSQPPSVYWRRRFILIAAVVLLVVLLAVTIEVATSGSKGTPAAAGTGSGPATPPTSSVPARPRTSATKTSPPPTHSSSVSAPATKTGKSVSPPATPVACKSSDLSVLAVAAQSSYKVGDEPMVEMQVTNTGSNPCVENLSDSEIVLKVYNGESRVWGSHDCKIEPGTNDQTLAVNAPVRVSITWTGLASKPGECNNRQRVGAGTYTLYATLAGKTGHAAQFSIS